LLVPDPRGVGRLAALHRQQNCDPDEARGDRDAERKGSRPHEEIDLREREDGREGRERIELVFPALALPEEMHEAVSDAERRDTMARVEAAVPRRRRYRKERGGR